MAGPIIDKELDRDNLARFSRTRDAAARNQEKFGNDESLRQVDGVGFAKGYHGYESVNGWRVTRAGKMLYEIRPFTTYVSPEGTLVCNVFSTDTPKALMFSDEMQVTIRKIKHIIFPDRETAQQALLGITGERAKVIVLDRDEIFSAQSCDELVEGTQPIGPEVRKIA